MPLRKINVRHEYPLTEAKDRFSALTSEANATGTPFVVLKGGKPWVEVKPLRMADHLGDSDQIHITPVHRAVEVADLDDLFAGYHGAYEPTEDEFAQSVGCEDL